MDSNVIGLLLSCWSGNLLNTSPTHRPLILCIDDDAASLPLRKEILEQNGFEVLTATSAADGMKLFLVKQVALVIADHLLRGTSGLALAGQMKRVKPSVPIIMLSGEPPSEYKHIDCYINKGESIHEMLRICRSLIERAEN